MFLATIAALVVSAGSQGQALVCPMMAETISKDSPAVDYNGVRYQFCCSGCDAAFMKGPELALKNEKLKDKMVGVFMFDPVSGKRVVEKKAKGSSDFNGIRYYFESADNKTAFDAEPKKFATLPKQEVLVCPVMGAKLTYAKADGYVDEGGVRYYTCCASCTPILKKDSSKFTATVAKSIQAPKAMKAPKQ